MCNDTHFDSINVLWRALNLFLNIFNLASPYYSWKRSICRSPQLLLRSVTASSLRQVELDIGSARCFISTTCILKILGACHIEHSKWSILAAHRDTLRHTIHQGVSSASISEKRRKRKNREAAAANHDRLSSAAAAIGPARHALGSPAQTRLRSMWSTPSKRTRAMMIMMTSSW